MKTLGIALVLIGVALFMYSLGMSPYLDEEQYMNEYLSINRKGLGSETATKLFYELRLAQLTPKYKIQDYALTIFSVGGILVLIFRKGVAIVRAPNSKLKISLVAFLAVLTTIFAFVGDLFLQFARGSFPHWADSLGIPLMGVPILFFIVLVWAIINLCGMCGNFKVGAHLFDLGLSGVNYWYVTLVAITAFIVLLAIVYGFFWFVIPGFLWLYFYLSIAAGRYSADK